MVRMDRMVALFFQEMWWERNENSDSLLPKSNERWTMYRRIISKIGMSGKWMCPAQVRFQIVFSMRCSDWLSLSINQKTFHRNMCCQKVNANLPIYNSTIDFTIDQILFGKPVFRHVNYHDIFLYQSKNDTDWIIGKGLLQNSILYFGKSKSGLAQEGFQTECINLIGW